jgi:hypothetical protein
MQEKEFPENWFVDIKEMSVRENIDYHTRQGSTTVVIYYRSWWKMRRKVKFPRVQGKPHGTGMHCRHPEAIALIARIKKILDPSGRKAPLEHEPPKAVLRSVLPVFTDHPRFTGWPAK